MCDSYVALPSATTTGTTLAAKNADCEINEAQAVLQLPRRRYPEGAMMRASHIVIPQARETHEIIIDKSYWTWGGEIGVNEHGVAVGNEAIFSKVDETGRRADHWRSAAADAGAGAQLQRGGRRLRRCPRAVLARAAIASCAATPISTPVTWCPIPPPPV